MSLLVKTVTLPSLSAPGPAECSPSPRTGARPPLAWAGHPSPRTAPQVSRTPSSGPSSYLLPTDEGAASQAQLDLVPVVVLRINDYILNAGDRRPLSQPLGLRVHRLGPEQLGPYVNVKGIFVLGVLPDPVVYPLDAPELLETGAMRSLESRLRTFGAPFLRPGPPFIRPVESLGKLDRNGLSWR